MKIIVIKILLISISFARTSFNLQLFVKDQKKKEKWASIIQVKSSRTYLVSIIKRQRKLDISVFDKYISTNFIQVHSILKLNFGDRLLILSAVTEGGGMLEWFLIKVVVISGKKD